MARLINWVVVSWAHTPTLLAYATPAPWLFEAAGASKLRMLTNKYMELHR